MKKAIAICTAAAMTLAMGTFTSSYVSAQENDTTFDSLTSTGTYDKYFGAEEGDVSISDVLNIDPEKNKLEVEKGSTISIPEMCGIKCPNNYTLTCKSEDTNIATIDVSGIVTGVEVGEVIITVTATNNDDESDSASEEVTVTVIEPAITEPPIASTEPPETSTETSTTKATTAATKVTTAATKVTTAATKATTATTKETIATTKETTTTTGTTTEVILTTVGTSTGSSASVGTLTFTTQTVTKTGNINFGEDDESNDTPAPDTSDHASAVAPVCFTAGAFGVFSAWMKQRRRKKKMVFIDISII